MKQGTNRFIIVDTSNLFYPLEYGVWLRSKECDWDDYVEEKIWGEESPEVDDGQESEDK
jgi:hypothetical protein